MVRQQRPAGTSAADSAVCQAWPADAGLPDPCCCVPFATPDDRSEVQHAMAPAPVTSKERCSPERDIVEVVRTEYVYTRPPPWSDTLPTIHVVTPTYGRPVQRAELTRLANTLLHVPNLHWILVEDAARPTAPVGRLLRNTGLNYTHLSVETPRGYKSRADARDPRIPRGTVQRNLALRWLRETLGSNSTQRGVVYFADDDNTYSLELFEEVRRSSRVEQGVHVSMCSKDIVLRLILAQQVFEIYKKLALMITACQ